ncbi:C6 transcription factor [Purpureocillium lavendulum]|uniref:C6 transcription factor n=1 Tax=Purpureocillium lavendulum TaxID=1247861 RepID=A0AB34FED6_9HYPO|nr:C6 transcription factor [Purpureocillium lavendulum]
MTRGSQTQSGKYKPLRSDSPLQFTLLRASRATPSDQMASQVSWQNAWWALVPLAMNSMLQPAGNIATFTSRTSLALRVSPIVCTADAIISLHMVVWYSSTRGMNLRSAARMWHMSRTQRLPHGHDTSPLDTASEASPLVRLAVFVIGTLLQSIKLFACEGIPWTQAWGYMFVVSFVVLETMLLLSRPVDDEKLRNFLLDHGANTPAYPEFVSGAIIILAILLHITLLAWILVFSLLAPPAWEINSDFVSLQWWQVFLMCDEQGPPCANCKIRNIECTYPPPPKRDQSPTWVIASYNSSSGNSQSPVRRPPTTPSPLSLSSSQTSNRLLELELMHRWTLRTWQGMYSLPPCRQFLQEILPREGLQHSFVLDGVLALAALDAALHTPAEDLATSRYYRRAALEYCTKASVEFRDAMNTQAITRDTLYLLSTFGCMAGYFNLAVRDEDVNGAERLSTLDRVHASFIMFIGCAQTAAINLEWLFDSPTSARLAAEEYYPRLEFLDLLDFETRTAINRMSTVNRIVRLPPTGDPAVDSEDGQGPISYDVWSYRLAVGQTKYCFAEEATGRIKGFLVSLPCMCGPEIVEGIRTREPMAMFILMYWGVLLDKCAADPWLWWAGTTGRDLVDESSQLLVRSPVFGLEDIREGVAWARRQVGLEAVLPVVEELA